MSEFSMTLRDKEVTVQFQSRDVDPPDDSVGIMGPALCDFKLLDSEGEELDWVLTEAEEDKVQEEFQGWYQDSSFDDDLDRSEPAFGGDSDD